MDKLNGKTITWTNGSRTESATVIIEPGVGFTLVNANDKDDYLTCAQGPLAVPEVYKEDEGFYLEWEIIWETAVRMLKAGKYDCRVMDQALVAGGRGSASNGAGQDNCAFSM